MDERTRNDTKTGVNSKPNSCQYGGKAPVKAQICRGGGRVFGEGIGVYLD